MIKNLFFTASFPPPLVGGSVEYIFNIVSNFPHNSVVIHTANLTPQEAKELDGLFPQRILRSSYITHVQDGRKKNVIVRKLIRLKEYILWPFFAFKLILHEHPDVIHIGEHNFAGVAAWLAQHFLRIPYIYYTYAEEITILSKRWLHNKLFLMILRGAAQVITVSQYTHDLLIKEGVSPDRITIVLPAVSDRKRIQVTEDQIELVRHKYDLMNCKVLLTVGSLEERKGHSSVINALSLLNQSIPGIRYVITGTGPKENDLKLQTQKRAITKQVVFTGRIEDNELNCLYEICDIFVMPHRQIHTTLDTEGCPTVFLEASAHGKPVIGGDAGGVADAIIHEETGYIINGTDEILLAGIIKKLLENIDLAKKMGEAGRKYTAGLTPEANSNKVYKIAMLAANKPT
jgi:phosphatidyl-myo-inositol dimannoside synthase